MNEKTGMVYVGEEKFWGAHVSWKRHLAYSMGGSYRDEEVSSLILMREPSTGEVRGWNQLPGR